MYRQGPEKMQVNCPECGTENEILWFPSSKTKIEVSGARAGKSTKWVGNSEKATGKCTKCGYKFKSDDI